MNRNKNDFSYLDTINLLCVEDSPADADLILRSLKDEGLDINGRLTENREQFVEELDQERPDIILSDFHLPGFNGFDALELAKKRYPEVPFIVVSGAVSVEEQIKLLRYKADDLILKDNLTRLPFAVMHALHIAHDRTNLQQALDELTEANREKEILLAEIHHRVKNNLAVISSFLELQKMYSDNERFGDLVSNILLRIKSIALVHEKLYSSNNLSRVQMGEFVPELISYIRDIAGPNEEVTIMQEVESLELNINQAVPCGLIISELVNNALKHAFPNRIDGKIGVRIYENGGRVFVEIQDDGIGLPEHLDFDGRDSQGLVIIDALIKQLQGELDTKNNNGTAIEFNFEKEAGKKGASSNLPSY